MDYAIFLLDHNIIVIFSLSSAWSLVKEGNEFSMPCDKCGVVKEKEIALQQAEQQVVPEEPGASRDTPASADQQDPLASFLLNSGNEIVVEEEVFER